MLQHQYRDLILAATTDPSGNKLDAIVAHFVECEEAHRILRVKGYGISGMSVSAIARLVPLADEGVKV